MLQALYLNTPAAAGVTSDNAFSEVPNNANCLTAKKLSRTFRNGFPPAQRVPKVSLFPEHERKQSLDSSSQPVVFRLSELQPGLADEAHQNYHYKHLTT